MRNGTLWPKKEKGMIYLLVTNDKEMISCIDFPLWKVQTGVWVAVCERATILMEEQMTGSFGYYP